MNAMKIVTRITVQILMILLIAFTLIMSFNACQKVEDPTEGVKLILNYDLLKTSISVKFYDASTGEQIGQDDNSQVSVNITGESSKAVIDMAGESGKTYKSGGGFMNLYLNPNVEYIPSLSNPIRFTLVATLEGYNQASQSMVISEEGEYFVELVMINNLVQTEGVESIKELGAGNVLNGEVQEDILVKTMNEKTAVVIREGTVIKDESGNQLSGSLDIEITYFDNRKDNTLAAFPGGLLTSMKKDGRIEDGIFYTAGFVSVDISDENGKHAKYFEGQPLLLTMLVQDQTYNPETSATVNSNDALSVYSFDPAIGNWDFEQIAIVESKSNGFEVTTELNHLSYWNFGWFFGNGCEQGVDLVFSGDQSGCECITVQGLMRKTEDDTFLKFVTMQACNDETVTVTNATADIPVYIEWLNSDCSSYHVNPAYNPLYINNLCSSEQFQVPMLNESGQTTTVTIDVSAHCVSYPDVEVHPTFGVWFREADKMCWRWAYMYDGEAEICDIKIGSDYVIGAYYNNTWNEWEVNVTQSEYVILNMELPDDVCDTMFN